MASATVERAQSGELLHHDLAGSKHISASDASNYGMSSSSNGGSTSGSSSSAGSSGSASTVEVGSTALVHRRIALQSPQQSFLVALLAQICATRDATPALFMDTCMRLYNAGLLDNLDFLVDMGLLRGQLPSRPSGPGGDDPWAQASPEQTASILRELMSTMEPHASTVPLRPMKTNDPTSALASLQSDLLGSAGAAFVSRYQRDFEELGVLGKGSFGTVVRVRNRVDGAECTCAGLFSFAG